MGLRVLRTGVVKKEGSAPEAFSESAGWLLHGLLFSLSVFVFTLFFFLERRMLTQWLCRFLTLFVELGVVVAGPCRMFSGRLRKDKTLLESGFTCTPVILHGGRLSSFPLWRPRSHLPTLLCLIQIERSLLHSYFGLGIVSRTVSSNPQRFFWSMVVGRSGSISIKSTSCRVAAGHIRRSKASTA